MSCSWVELGGVGDKRKKKRINEHTAHCKWARTTLQTAAVSAPDPSVPSLTGEKPRRGASCSPLLCNHVLNGAGPIDRMLSSKELGMLLLFLVVLLPWLNSVRVDRFRPKAPLKPHPLSDDSRLTIYRSRSAHHPTTKAKHRPPHHRHFGDQPPSHVDHRPRRRGQDRLWRAGHRPRRRPGEAALGQDGRQGKQASKQRLRGVVVG